MTSQTKIECTCFDCGHPLVRDEARPLTIHYKGLTATFPMPGFYCVNCGEGIHNGKDMETSDHNLNLLKAQMENRPPPAGHSASAQERHGNNYGFLCFGVGFAFG